MAIRVLVVDDSVVIRRVLCDVLAKDPDLEVIATASDGRIALAKIAQLRPDVVTLDVEMPVMDGLQTLVELRKLYPKLPVIMFSTLTERGAAATLDALSAGASDYATKAINTGSPERAMEAIRSELIPKIKALGGSAVAAQAKTAQAKTAQAKAPSSPGRVLRAKRPPNARIDIVTIGTSTGGPNALAEVLPRIPKDFPVPIVVVQHMPPVFTRLLAERLAGKSAITIDEGIAGVAIVPGGAWIAPGNFHMTVKRVGAFRRLDLNQDAPENSCRPAVDVLFRSVAACYGANALGVVMTGMGSDGVIGARAIRDAGGEVLVQDEATAVVWGMPGLVYAAGQADGVYPLDQLAPEITRRVLQSRPSRAIPDSERLSTMESRVK